MLKVGIIGCGSMGKGRADWCSRNPDVKLTAFCSRTEEKAEELSAQYGGEVFTDWQKMLSEADVDAVFICTPNYLHFPIAMEAVRHGKHTAVEYPLALNLDDFDTLASEAAKRNLVLHHGLTCRFDDYYLTIKDALPQIGKPLCAKEVYFGRRIRFYCDEEKRGNLWVSIHVHFIEHMRGLFGDPLWIDAANLTVTDEATPVGIMLMGFPNGVTGYVEAGLGIEARPGFTWSVIGTKGRLEFGNSGVTLHTADKDETLTNVESDSIGRDTECFLAQVLRSSEAAVSLSEARKAMEISLAADESARTGQRVYIK